MTYSHGNEQNNYYNLIYCNWSCLLHYNAYELCMDCVIVMQQFYIKFSYNTINRIEGEIHKLKRTYPKQEIRQKICF